ncbi:hypothetical protein COTS27_00970 [Spirochaetota bacterium]|nr:hypothetical protein COTS27_00970 [Spirochaetota bacterium]
MITEDQNDDVETNEEDISLTKSELDEIIDSSTIISERGSSAAETHSNDDLNDSNDPNTRHHHEDTTDTAVMEDIVSLDMDAHLEHTPGKDVSSGEPQTAEIDEQLDTSLHNEAAEMTSLDDINHGDIADLDADDLGAENPSAAEELTAPLDGSAAADAPPPAALSELTEPASTSAEDPDALDKMADLELPLTEDNELSLNNKNTDAVSDDLTEMMVEKETVALSGNELDNLIDNLDKSGGNIEVSASDQLAHTAPSPPTARLTEPDLVLSQEFKELFKHLDDLMTHLPKEKVEAFAHSKYFKKYTQIVNAVSKA